MAIAHYNLDDHVATLTLNYGENKINPEFISELLSQMDDIERKTSATTLVVHSSHNKIFSNGIDLEWIAPIIQAKNIKKAKKFFYLLNKLFKRILTYPLTTIASINGHAFAGGAILCCAFDFRFMRSDRGFFCLPEIDLGIPFLPGMNEIIKKAMPIHVVEYMEYTGVRLTAEECMKHNIITQKCHGDSLLQQTIDFAKTINKRRSVIKEIKTRLNKSIIRAIDIDDVEYIESGTFNIE